MVELSQLAAVTVCVRGTCPWSGAPAKCRGVIAKWSLPGLPREAAS